ncbi:hypothetical protein [Acanthopleuribacter pedis]|uniref:Uncharacterized protein n=1 Tax=Acanthopleuribacter pedis TaxID=442870 RepID=A0A8J7QMX9_9BACT|nr:hypothetical protein [Acanthopleuribacter pedis]MBO1321353.1 hypothetical protein [Acanthopleuribacter pedis]
MQKKEERFRFSDLAYLIPVLMLAAIGLISLGPVIWLSLTMLQTMGVETTLWVFFAFSWLTVTGFGFIKWWDATFSPANLRWKWLVALVLLPILGGFIFLFVETNRKPSLTLVSETDA